MLSAIELITSLTLVVGGLAAFYFVGNAVVRRLKGVPDGKADHRS